MTLSKLLVRSSVFFSFFFLLFAIAVKPKSVLAQSSSGIAIFVNGNGDCCANNMREVRQALADQGFTIITTPWDRFAPEAEERAALGAKGWTLGSLSNDRDFVNQLPAFVNSLPAKVPVVLIGHSFGGDSLLSAVPRINRRILFLGVLDPVAAGGLRAPIRNRNVPGTVDYFFNRWQTTNVWPVENRTPGVNTNGSVRCSAKQCDDQHEQSEAKNADGSTITSTVTEVVTEAAKCGISTIFGGLAGAASCNVSVVKNSPLQHEEVPTDAYIQRQIVDLTKSLVASSPPVASSIVIPQPDEESNRPRLIPLALYWNGQREDNSTVATLAMRRSQEQSGYAGPNIQGCILSKPETGTIPLLLFWHPQREDNVTVATEGAIQSQIDSGYGNRAVQGYIYSAQQPGTIPLLLFWHPQREDNATVATKGAIRSQIDSGYGNPAIQGYIYPADKCSK